MRQPPLVVMVCGGILAAFLVAVLLFSPEGALAARTHPGAGGVTNAEAQAWAEARAADTAGAYRVYLAAYPDGQFVDDAHSAIDRMPNAARSAYRNDRAPAAARQPVVYRPSRAQIASACRSYVDNNWPAPSRLTRMGGGAAGGCAIGLLAGGDDGRNCVVGAVAGGAAGAVSVSSRERRRRNEMASCVANGGPP